MKEDAKAAFQKKTLDVLNTFEKLAKAENDKKDGYAEGEDTDCTLPAQAKPKKPTFGKFSIVSIAPV